MSEEGTLPRVVKLKLLQDKIQLWRNTLYDAELDAKVAVALEDERNKEHAEQRMKAALKALDVLGEILGGLDGDE